MDRNYVYEDMEEEAARELEENERIEAERAREELEAQAELEPDDDDEPGIAAHFARAERISKIKAQAGALLASMRDSDMQIGTIALCKLVVDLAEELDR